MTSSTVTRRCCALQIYGDGAQTRSFQYVSDLVDGLVALMHGNYSQPCNIGNPEEYTIAEFAERIKELAGALFVLSRYTVYVPPSLPLKMVLSCVSTSDISLLFILIRSRML